MELQRDILASRPVLSSRGSWDRVACVLASSVGRDLGNCSMSFGTADVCGIRARRGRLAHEQIIDELAMGETRGKGR
jgi:hypothetical protein